MTANATRIARARRLGVAAGLCLAAGAVVGCGGSTSTSTTTGASGGSGTSTPTRTLRYGIPASNVVSGVSNPAEIQATDGPVLSIAYDSLFHVEPDGKIVPGLASKWRYVDAGQKQFEFTLRQDAVFSDGSPVNAKAVVGWLEYYLKSKNVYSGLLGKRPKFTAVDEWTVRVTMEAPLPNLPFLFSEANVNWGFVASPKAVANPDLMKKGTYGAGPYMLDYAQSVPGDHYTYVPNPHYYDKSRIRFKQIEMKAFKEASSALQAQQAGQIDVGWTTDATTAPAAEAAGLKVVSAPFAVFYFALNSKGQKPLTDVRVRRALNYAIDRKAIANALFNKYGVPSSQFTIPPDANPGMEDHYGYDPKQAKALLAEAGYADGFPMQLDVGPDPIQTKSGELVAHYLDEIGIKTKVQPFQTRAAYLKRALPLKDDAAVFAGDVGVPTPIEYPSYIGPGSALGAADPENPKVDQLYQEGLRARDPSVAWKQMWAIPVTDAWFLPLAASSNLVYVSKGVEGVEMSPPRPYAYPTEWSFGQ